ncbi:hypothetical protein L227DRAFT_58763 [Lentinus tigrinus ALCF2SS1-6]|uniref:Sds3-like-domain-containing protein n=2 Tax=Lentinus tigrinus TaxID=5365 RepID=A0A5C2SD50_9APHY|nr:hypothetical protein L227DRAFT_58763 [Lentinus tigrinus ALCF2SS1-6]
MDVDAPPAVLMSPVAVAATSIMAGASLLQPASPSSSTPSTPSGSRASSRFPSAEPEQEQDVPSEPEAEPEPERRATSARGGRRTRKGRTRAPRRSRVAAAVDAEVEGDVENPEFEGEGADVDDDVATPDVDLDSDMQPAHRAEALDVLAAIELKFALLRERLYVEKMDSLAWEEGLIADGTHPELLHLHAELSNRRDKRVELATRRRDYEVENVRKRRRLDEAGAWSTWKNDRDELQTTMIAETNGKKRRLERERKLIERPPPTRRFPMPLHEVPPAPTLREIVRNSPFGLPDSAPTLRKRSRKKELASQVPLAYPTLEPLSRHEIIQDLEMFWQHHRNAPIGYNPHSHMPGLMNAVLGGGMPHGMDPYAMGMPIMDGPGPARFIQPHIPQQAMVQNFGPPPRLPHHHSAPPGALPHLSHAQQVQLEQEMQAGMRQPGIPPHPSFAPGPGPGTLMRRSISPVPLSNGAGPSSVPTTLGGGPVPSGFSGPKPNGWSGPPANAKESKRMNGEADARERERIAEAMAQRERADRERAQRDLDREREREAERAYHMSHTQPRHSAHQHAHQHAVHGPAPGQAAHHHVPHNHQHHHHHVHHHHHPPPPQGFNGPGSNAHAPPMAGLPPGSNQGLPNPSLSPHSMRDFEQRRPRSGAPTEVIELSAPTQKQTASPGMSVFWQGSDEPGIPADHLRERERDRERERAAGPLGPPQPGPNERLMTPFTMGPSQTLQRSLPGSPRNPLSAGPSNPPPSVPSSRRGSWSMAPEDARPSSASHRPPESSHPMAGSSGSQRAPATRLPQPPSTSSYHSPFGSPPRNGRALPPASPSATPFSGPLRSPVRGGQQGRVPIGGPGPLSPPPSLPLSPRAMGSTGSKLLRMPSPPLTRAPLTKLSGFPIPESGNIAPIMSTTSGPMPPASLAASSLLSPLPGLPAPGAPPGRTSNGPLAEKAPQLPAAKSVPVSVDGS